MSSDYTFSFKPAPWMEKGNCKGFAVDVFFPEVGENADYAKAICNGSLGRELKDGTVIPAMKPCPVKQECLMYALDHPLKLLGVWGGTSERERRRLNYRGFNNTKGSTVTAAQLPPHGSVLRYNLEMAVNGQPCEDCTLAKWRQDNARQDNPKLAEAIDLITETVADSGS